MGKSAKLRASRFGDQAFPHRQRNKGTRLQQPPDLVQKLHGFGTITDQGRNAPVNTGRSGTLVAFDPAPRNGEEVPVMDEVEHIDEKTVRIADRPVVQFRLHRTYPQARLIEVDPTRFIGIHQCLRSLQ